MAKHTQPTNCLSVFDHFVGLALKGLKTRTAMNARISVFVICVEAIIYLLPHNLHDCTFNVYKSVRKAHLWTVCDDVSLRCYF